MAIKTVKPILRDTFETTAAVSAKRFVGFDGAHAAAGGNVLGIAPGDYVAGATAMVTQAGTEYVTAGGAIAAGASVEVGSGAKAVTLVNGEKVAVAQEAAAADGDTIIVRLV